VNATVTHTDFDFNGHGLELSVLGSYRFGRSAIFGGMLVTNDHLELTRDIDLDRGGGNTVEFDSISTMSGTKVDGVAGFAFWIKPCTAFSVSTTFNNDRATIQGSFTVAWFR
jgi:hypothetical protein